MDLRRCVLHGAGAPLGAILNFLLQLGFREVGSAFRVDSLSPVERSIAADVAQLGLLMPFMCARSRPPAPVCFLGSKPRTKYTWHIESAGLQALVGRMHQATPGLLMPVAERPIVPADSYTLSALHRLPQHGRARDGQQPPYNWL